MTIITNTYRITHRNGSGILCRRGWQKQPAGEPYTVEPTRTPKSATDAVERRLARLRVCDRRVGWEVG